MLLSSRSTSSRISRELFSIQRHNIHTKFAIVGGGTAGMNVCAQLLSSKTATPSDITVFEPNKMHQYQPGYTMVAGGVLGDNDTTVRKKLGGLIQRPMYKVFNSNINFIRDSIGGYDADKNTLYTLNNDETYTYDILIVCSGIELRYDLIDGLQDALSDPTSSVGSMYNLQYALKMNQIRSKFKGGKVIATQPPMPFKCGGAPQKWIYLTEYAFRKMGIKENIESFKFYTHLNCMFGVKKYDRELRILVEDKQITPMYQTELIKVEDDKKLAWFKNINTDEVFSDSYDLLHVVPPQKANKVTASASFADANGFVDVDHFTLQSKKYDNIFSIGDSNNCPNPKTAAAVFAATPGVIENINRVLKKQKLVKGFDGYASCPIFVGDGKLMLAEFTYGGVPNETFWIDQAVPNKMFYYLKKDFFPFVYWNLAPKGRWFGTNTIFKPSFKE